MTQEIKYELQLYYGMLMQELETSYDYFEKKRIAKKMKAIETLLDIDFLT